MKLKEFCQRVEKNSLVEPDAIRLIMEKLIEMPLDKMYSVRMNDDPGGSFADEVIMEIIGLEHYGKASSVSLKHFLNRMAEMAGIESKKEDLKLCQKALSCWSINFVPDIYRRKR